jgi:hypothetical protein
MGAEEMIELPASVAEIADVIGPRLTNSLLAQLPRIRNRPRHRCLYVPKRLNSDHALIGIIGLTAAQALVNAFGGEIMHLPDNRCFRNQYRADIIIEHMARGGRAKVLADYWADKPRWTISERHIRNIFRQWVDYVTRDDAEKAA